MYSSARRTCHGAVPTGSRSSKRLSSCRLAHRNDTMTDCSNSASAKGGTPRSDEPSCVDKKPEQSSQICRFRDARIRHRCEFQIAAWLPAAQCRPLVEQGVPVDLQHEVLQVMTVGHFHCRPGRQNKRLMRGQLDRRPIDEDLCASPDAKLLSEPGERREFLIDNCPKGCIREHDVTEYEAIAAGTKSVCALLQLQFVVPVGFCDRLPHFMDIRRSDEGKPVQWLDVHANPHLELA